MTPKERAAMQQALGALVRAEAMYGQPNADIQAALREALEQPESQEPVAWCWMLGECAHIVWGSRRPDDAIHTTPLYAAPVRTKDLTDDEIRAIRFNWERNEFAIDFARAVIAADREKNK